MDYRMLMFRYEAGEKRVIPLSKDAFDSNSIVITIDEKNKAIWLWLGANTSLISRRGAMRIARGLLGFGTDYGEIKVGIGCNDLIIIDERNLDPETTKKMELLIETMAMAESSDGKLFIVREEGSRVARTEKVEEVVAPTPKPEEVEKEAPSKPTITTPKVAKELDPNIKAAALIYATLNIFSELYITKHKNKVVIEGETGTLTNFNITKDGIELDATYNFQGKQKNVLKEYENLMKLISS
ncbi:MAG: hypothetical protein J7L50_01000 [Candidatus Odinarchaeota archaeon]|nr:hypothetical protein [Candidatus Odinarchaeota archaeon]